MKRQIFHVVATFGLLLGLGALGCTERNPAFHRPQPVDGGPAQPRDAAMDSWVSVNRPPIDSPVFPRDAELRPDTPIVPRDVALDSLTPMDAGISADTAPDLPSDLLALKDGHAEDRPSIDTSHATDISRDTGAPDQYPSVLLDADQSSPDAEATDLPLYGQDGADVSAEIGDASLSTVDAAMGEDVLPDAEEPDISTDSDDSGADSEPSEDV